MSIAALEEAVRRRVAYEAAWQRAIAYWTRISPTLGEWVAINRWLAGLSDSVLADPGEITVQEKLRRRTVIKEYWATRIE